MMTPEVLWAAGLALTVILTAALINRFAPQTRARLRTIAFLYIFYLLALGSSHVLADLHEPDWARRTLIAIFPFSGE